MVVADIYCDLNPFQHVAPLHLLLVEADSHHAAMIGRVISKECGEELTFHHADRVADLPSLDELKVDAILLSVNELKTDPVALINSVRKRFPETAIIALGVSHDFALAKACVLTGAQDFLDKGMLVDQGHLVFKSILCAVERQRATNALTLRNKDLSRYAHLVAHEVKRPMHSVMTALFQIEECEKGELDPISVKMLSLAQSSLNDAQNLTNELLRLAEAGSSDADIQVVSMSNATQQAMGSILAQHDASEIDIACDPLPPVLGNSLQLRLVFENLFANAVLYRGEKTPTIRVFASREDNQMGVTRFTVRDNGRGIPEAKHGEIFDLFHRLKESSHVPGSGIGLAFCKQVIERHGGRIWIESHNGSGSSFCFTLPKVPTAEMLDRASPPRLAIV